jgi:hypothetical protein
MSRVVSFALLLLCVLSTSSIANAANLFVSGPLLIDATYIADNGPVQNVIVRDGGSLEVEGVAIEGNIIVQSGGSLALDGGTVQGNVVVQTNGSFVSFFSMVQGNVVSNGSLFTLFASEVGGNVNVSRAADGVLISGLIGGGNVILSKVETEFGISLDTIAIPGNLILTNNDGGAGGFFVVLNEIDGNLIAINNSPPPAADAAELEANQISVGGNVIFH